MLESRHYAGGGERPALGRDTRGGIEPDRLLRVGRVEIAHVIDARTWDGVENVERQVAMGVNYSDALSPADVPHRQVEQKCAFAAARFPDDVNMTLAFLARELNT